MSEMMSASQEQSSGIEQINMAIMQMDNVTQQNAALVEEAAAAAQALQEQVHCLNDVVRVFQLDSRLPALHPVRQPVTGMVPPVMPKPPLIPATTSRAGQYKTLESEWQQF
jgi:methyl-accepting chemotaxis protein